MTAPVSQRVKIVNDLGLHLRAAGTLVSVASQYISEIWLERDSIRANAKSIMSVLALAASKGTEIQVVAEGEDAADATQAVCNLISNGFVIDGD